MRDKFVKLTKRTETGEIIIYGIKSGQNIAYFRHGLITVLHEKQAHEAGFCIWELNTLLG